MKYLSGEKLEDIITNEVTLVDYYADWCGPCRMLSDVLEDLKDTVKIIKVNTDDHPELSQTKGVMTIPFVEIYKDKEVKTTFIGFKNKEEIKKMLEEI